MSNGDQGNNEGGPADKTETQTTVVPPTETEAQEQIDEVQQGAVTQGSDPAGSAAALPPIHMTAGERIAALQAEIEAVRAAEAEAHKDDPFVLHLAPGIIGAVYHVTESDVRAARLAGVTVLEQVASKLGIASPEHLYQVNQAEIDRTAREAGHPGSDNGLIVPAGTGLYIEPASAVKEPAGVH